MGKAWADIHDQNVKVITLILTIGGSDLLGGHVQLTLRVSEEDLGQELRSLHDWLQMDRPIRRSTQVELVASRPPVPGHQGPFFDVVSLAIGSGFSAASLGVAVASWRATRPQQPAVTIERPDGTTVTISGESHEEAQRLIQQLLDERS